MRIDVGSIIGQKGLKMEWECQESFIPEHLPFKEPLSARFTLTNLGQGEIMVEGTIKGVLALSCSHCLLDFLLPVELLIGEEYVPARRAPYKDDKEISLEELSIFTYEENNILDLSEPVRQALLLSLPAYPLCKPDCKGLCPRCGKNRNEGECGCPEESKDEHWAPLKDLESSLPAHPKRRSSHAKPKI